MFGRLHAPDPRDQSYPLRALLAAERSLRTYRYWNANGVWLDQEATSTCVGHALVHWAEDGPVSQSGPAPCISPFVVYREAQLVDEWPGPPPDYDGTSVRAGAKVMQQHGFIASYHWAESLDDIVQAVLEVGPVVMGTDWFSEMMDPDPMGFIRATGRVVGGHAYVINGINTSARVARVKNSWSRSWGTNGHALLTLDDLDLLLSRDGEAMLAVEIRR